MSDNEAPRPNRTVFQPSPLQQRRSATGAPAPGAAPPVQPPPPADIPAPEQPTVAPAPRFAPVDDIPRPPTAPAQRNPLLARAAPLLALLASVRSGRARLALPDLHRRAMSEISAVQSEFTGKLADDPLRRAVYALAVTADDVALNLPLPETEVAEWAQRSLGALFFQEAIGGDRFWRLLDEMIARPTEFQDLLELYHACMAAGFEGRYRVMSDGRHAHQALMQRVFQTLERARRTSQTELAPHWRGVDAPRGKVGLWAPLALAVAVAVGLLLVINIALRLMLAHTGEPAREALAKLGAAGPLTLSARESPPPPETPQVVRIRQFLAPEIAAHQVEVKDTPVGVRVITTEFVQDFDSGSDQIAAGARGLFDRISQAINTEPGGIEVDGYTDFTKPHGLTFPDNDSLSKARADTVAALIRGKLTDASRAVTAQGFGDSNPLATNDTPQGRARNRRVEILIERTGQ
jgi:type VI secretion system protein ImpK